MNFSLKSLTLLAGLAVMPLLAVPTIKITDITGGGAPITVVDQLAPDTDPVGNVVGFDGTLNDWKITASALTSFSSTAPSYDFSSQFQRLTGAYGQIMIEFFETGFTTVPFQGEISYTVQRKIGSAVNSGSVETSFDVNGVSQGTETLNFPPNNSLGGFTGGVSNLTPYSVKITQIFTFNAGTVNRIAGSQGSLATVPEPGFYGALALGLSGLFAVVARRRKANAE